MWKNEKIRANTKSKNRENERKEPIENPKSNSLHFCTHGSGKKPKCFLDSDDRPSTVIPRRCDIKAESIITHLYPTESPKLELFRTF